MKIVIALCLIAVAAANSHVQKSCRGNAEPGRCAAYFVRYYYDTQTGTCKQFIYGGCEGNGNNYESESECLRNCKGTGQPTGGIDDPRRPGETGGTGDTRRPDICRMPPSQGPCNALIPRYFYNIATKRCEEFMYGGCQGNKNNFQSRSECERNCGSDYYPRVQASPDSRRDICFLEPKRGKCLAYMVRYYFNSNTGRCEEFVYGGCQGNENNFKTLEECKGACNAYAPGVLLDRPDCDAPAESGLCRAYIPRYYYDRDEGQCKKFIYGGCGGNRNNFETEQECYNKCGALASDTPVCEQHKEVGPCYAGFRRYHYNKETKQCELFIYGGCRGNQNNFKTKKECQEKCVSA